MAGKWLPVAAVLAMAALPLALRAEPYYINLLVQTYIFAGVAAAWNITGGFAGQLSFGHGVFFGAGAYVVSLLLARFGLSPWITIWIGVALSLLLSLVFYPTFRLRGPFFAIATMALNQVALSVANSWVSVTGGPHGVQIPFRPSLANMMFRDRTWFAFLALANLLIILAVTWWVSRSRLGFQLMAVREDEDAARMMGISPSLAKLKGLLLSAALTSMCGSLNALYIRYIDPPSLFSLTEIGARFPLIAMIGGLGTVGGPILGAFLFVPLSVLLRGALGAGRPGMHLVVFGFLLILCARFFKQGLVGLAARLLDRHPVKGGTSRAGGA